MIKLTARQQQILGIIRDAIENSGLPPTRAEIAAELGFRSINAAEEHLQALARKGAIKIIPGVSRGIRLVDAKSEDELQQKTFPHANFKQVALPLVGRVAAGSPILASGHVEKTFHVDPSFFSEQPDFLLKVNGMSMKDVGIMDGDLLAVKKVNQVRNGEIVVARIGDDVTVKRFEKLASHIELHSENPDFDVIKVEGELENFAIEGRAVGVLRTTI